MILPAESFRVFLSARSFAAVSGETETAMRTRFTAFVLPARFAFPRIEAEIFAFVAELFGACFQGSFFMGNRFSVLISRGGQVLFCASSFMSLGWTTERR